LTRLGIPPIQPPGTWQLTASSGLCDAASDAESFFHWFVKVRYLRAIVIARFFLMNSSQLSRACFTFRTNSPERSEWRLTCSQFGSEYRRRFEVEWSINCARSILTGPIIVMHVGPTWPVKEWPAQRWIELGEKIFAASLGSIIQIGANFDSYGRPTVRIPNATRLSGSIQGHFILRWRLAYHVWGCSDQRAGIYLFIREPASGCSIARRNVLVAITPIPDQYIGKLAVRTILHV
jgi:hypothetical protein